MNKEEFLIACEKFIGTEEQRNLVDGIPEVIFDVFICFLDYNKDIELSYNLCDKIAEIGDTHALQIDQVISLIPDFVDLAVMFGMKNEIKLSKK